MLSSLATFALVTLAASADQPPELGRVHFLRSVDEGLARASSEKKPVFLLFDEIPGCSTCKGFGAGPLSQPLLVEAIETLFVPVCVHNNKGGADAAALKRFGEPAWNNPVVRFLDAQGRDLIAREDDVWVGSALATCMRRALSAAQQPAPAWLELAELDARRDELPRAVFAMRCFWEGQATLGALDGIADARPAFLDGLEVVELRYDPRSLPLSKLVRAAEDAGLARKAWFTDAEQVAQARTVLGERAQVLARDPQAAPDSDDLRALKRSPVRALVLPRPQAVRVNAELAARGEPSSGTLSPRQREELRRRASAAK